MLHEWNGWSLEIRSAECWDVETCIEDLLKEVDVDVDRLRAARLRFESFDIEISLSISTSQGHPSINLPSPLLERIAGYQATLDIDID